MRKTIAKINTAARADFVVNPTLNLFRAKGPELLAALAAVEHHIERANAVDADVDPIVLTERRVITAEIKRRADNRAAKIAARKAA